MIESGQISGTDPVQKQLQSKHKATTNNTRYKHTHKIEEIAEDYAQAHKRRIRHGQRKQNLGKEEAWFQQSQENIEVKKKLHYKASLR